MVHVISVYFLVAVSGLSGSRETAQDQVSVGMGLLAGSTVMLLTSIWGTCIVVGKCDLQNLVAQDNKDTKGFHLIGITFLFFLGEYIILYSCST